MVEGEGFEPSKAEPADLQSAPFDRSGTPPKTKAAHYSLLNKALSTDFKAFMPSHWESASISHN